MPLVKQEEQADDQSSEAHAVSGVVLDSAPVRVKTELAVAEPTKTASSQVTFSHLQQAITQESATVLGHHKSTGPGILRSISQVLDSIKPGIDIDRWSQSVKDLIQQAKTPVTTIGVVGGTGQGKSSVINALADETKLVPTNCVRACTAVITELSWNPSEDPDHRYVAEVEFITADEWQYELKHLFQDLMGATGEVSDEGSNRDADVGVAWAKIKAVYPQLTKVSLANTNVESLANDPAVKSLLGTTKSEHSPTIDDFYQAIRVYIDSKEKLVVSDTADGEDEGKHRHMELWPLIKVVRIRTKCDALSTGAIIVDLPSVEDSNAARSAVAGKYVERCNAIWIVTSITRAVDDKTAQKLLGQSFKQQLRFDGNSSNITFICSKTDNILRAELKKWESTQEAELENDKKRTGSLSAYVTELDKRLRQWESLAGRQSTGVAVYAPKETTRKRKATVQGARTRKRRRTANDEISEDVSAYVSANNYWDNLEKDIPKFGDKQGLTGENIRCMLEFLWSQKATASEEKEQLDEKIEARLTSRCIAARSEYARKSIRSDYALGLKELDQDSSQGENPAACDPEHEVRDYNQVARSLPVFCVSSRAYQEKCGRLDTEDQFEGFETPETTEIPQLIAHAKKSTEARCISNDKAFLNDLLQVLNSLFIWSSKSDFEIPLTDEEKKDEMASVKFALVGLEKELKAAVNELVRKCKNILSKRIFDLFESSVTNAAKCAPSIAQEWPRVQKGGNGLPCVSYKAACRREGVYSGKMGPRDFNEEPSTPLKKGLGAAWERTFSKKIPQVLKEFTKVSAVQFQKLHDHMKGRLEAKVTFTSLNMLQGQVKARAREVDKMINSFGDEITAVQREASRDFTPAIKQRMTRTYTTCAQDKGSGVFFRIQNAMMQEIREQGKGIFSAATDPVKKKLIAMCDKLQSDLEAQIATMLDRMNSDYANLILGPDMTDGSRAGREAILQILKAVNGQFEPSQLDGLEL
ncbi:Uu.00g002940.m01.CDS01 [Anthostomella pinea]|uniref:Uu.00g002940.m01.CDS01 n=1 Tax=Anthostomella pinea TaxID=933095 RepID=A0AAI8YG89_9PEZI|nr:Uu.00g002940.m01.CDS01 [Anthostomella pinea]